MIESNFYILSTLRLKPSDQERRLKRLENTLAQLRQYHKVARPLKRPVVFRLIVNYESLVERIKGA